MMYRETYNTLHSQAQTVLLSLAPVSNMYSLHADSLEFRVKYTSPKPYFLLLLLHFLCRLLASLPPDPILPQLEDLPQLH